MNSVKNNIPPNLTSEEIKCFNEVVKPQLEELYSYNYDIFELRHVKISISKDKFPDNIKRPSIEEIGSILNKIPGNHLKFVSEIYFVSYHCKEDMDDLHKEINGRTLPIVYKTIIYPKAYSRLGIILTHEIGHLIFEKESNKELKLLFVTEVTKSFPQIIFWPQKEKDKFVREEFANCYDNLINNPYRLKNFPFLYDFFTRYFS